MERTRPNTATAAPEQPSERPTTVSPAFISREAAERWQESFPAGSRPPIFDIGGDPFVDPDARAKLHAIAPAMVYDVLLGAYSKGIPFVSETAAAYFADVVSRMKPRDDAERMVISHLVWTHARLMKLNHMLAAATKIDDVRKLSDLVDRAESSFRKVLLSLTEYRAPRRRRTTTTVITRQLNQASQQVVNNNGREDAQIEAPQRRTLHGGRTRALTSGDQRPEAVAAVDRTTHRGGKGAKRAERDTTRGVRRRGSSRSK